MKPKRSFPLFAAKFSAVSASFFASASVYALTYTWDGTNNAPWSDAKWSDGTNSAINWVNDAANDAVVNSGDVWSPIGITANSLTIGDGVGDSNSASARFATNNAFWGITSITINPDGSLGGSANCTSHLLTVNLNGGTIGGGDNGGDAAFYGAIALHGPVNVNGGAATSTISTTGGGVLLVGPTAGTPTEFNVADGAAETDLLVSGNLVHKPFGDSEALLKTGAGKMVLSGTNAYQGPTTVSGGILSITTPFLFDTSTITIDAGAKMDLNFTGYDNVGSLVINGTTVANGIYNKDHVTYGSYFTGAGSLVVGGGPSTNGSWISTVNGDWSNAANWQSGAIANGPDQTATFSAGTGSESITATLDSNRTIGSLAFSNANYTITGASTLTLESSGTPAIGVATGLSATINSNLASSLEVAKTGAGTLNLYAGAGDNMSNTYNHSLGGMDIQNGTVSLDSQFIRLGSVNIASGATLTATQPWATGASNPWFNGRSVGPITVQAGGTLTTTVGLNGIMEGLTLLGGSVTAPGVTSGQWGAFTVASNVLADGAVISTISAELAIVNDPGFDVTTGSTLNITGAMHHRFGAAASGIQKDGEGLLQLGGINSYTGNTFVNAGTLELADNAQLTFAVTDGSQTQITGTSTGTATMNGDFNIDTSAVTGETGGIWLLVDLANLNPASSFANTFTVVGFDDSNNDGIWTMTDAKGDWSFSETTGELTLDIGNDYDDWANANGVTGVETEDDDSDGLSNFDEYAFGLDPTGGAEANPIVSQLNKSTGQFSYTRRLQSKTSLTYTVRSSTTLAANEWTDLVKDTDYTESVSASGDLETVTITLTPAPTAAKLFIQVRAQ